MKSGVYIVANDRVFDQAIALLSSLRLQDQQTPVFMIPFNEDYQNVWQVLSRDFNVQLFPDLLFLEKLTQDIANIFPRDFLKLPNKMRKLAAWFGPLDKFIYIDTDILLFEPIQDTLSYLQKADFICCDFHHKGRGLSDVFSPLVREQSIFSETELQDVFNSGFWGSQNKAFTYETMLKLLGECAAHREYFDFSSGTTDQPIINYLVLKQIERRLNLTKVNVREPGSWGGSSHFREKKHILYDDNTRLRYLHWAGTPMRPQGPYWDIWEYYRFRVTSEPLKNLKPQKPMTLWQRLQKKLSL
ncbi:MAG: Npun_R2821/Npun_R2822 family protein [Cyanobacteria bacterium P01_H01_bin.105]